MLLVARSDSCNLPLDLSPLGFLCAPRALPAQRTPRGLSHAPSTHSSCLATTLRQRLGPSKMMVLKDVHVLRDRSCGPTDLRWGVTLGLVRCQGPSGWEVGSAAEAMQAAWCCCARGPGMQAAGVAPCPGVLLHGLKVSRALGKAQFCLQSGLVP